jgi:hypothetical protein
VTGDGAGGAGHDVAVGDDESEMQAEADRLAKAFAEMVATASLEDTDTETVGELLGPVLAEMTVRADIEDGEIDMTVLMMGCAKVALELVDMVQDSEWRVGLPEELSRADIWAEVRSRLNEDPTD